MYKWHSQLISRSSRPLSRDLQVASEGIAASMRAFSISAAKAAESEDKPRFTITRQAVDVKAPTTRSDRTKSATDAISSLRPSTNPPRGVDARALGAPLKIIRQDFTRQGTEGAEGQRPRFTSPTRGRGGRGGMRGRGGGRGGRGGAARGPRLDKDGNPIVRGPKPKRTGNNFELEIEPPTPEYIAYMEALESGILQPAPAGQTSVEALQNYVPAMGATSLPMGEVMALREHYRAITGQAPDAVYNSAEHNHEAERGLRRLFLDDADRAAVSKVDGVPGERYCEGTRAVDPSQGWMVMGRSRKEWGSVEPEVREAMVKHLVGGIYPVPELPMARDTVGAVQLGAIKNETYLESHTKKIMSKVQGMVPIPKGGKTVGKAARA